MCNYEGIGVYGEVCEKQLWRKERERQIQFTATSYSNLCWLFWRSNGEALSDWASIFIEDSSLIVLQFGRWDYLLEVCRSVWNFVKSCCPQEVLVTVNFGFFVNPTVKSSLIALKFLIEFYHSWFVVLDGQIWDQSCSLFSKNSWTLSIFLVTRFLNSYLF